MAIIDGKIALAHKGSQRAPHIEETLSANFVTPGQKDGGASLCPGDSGGPVYRTGSKKLIGINADYTFEGPYEARGSIAKTNIHARFDAPKVKGWLKNLLNIQEPLVRPELGDHQAFAMLTTMERGLSALAISTPSDVKRVEICQGRTACDQPLMFSYLRTRDNRSFFIDAFTPVSDYLTIVMRSERGDLLAFSTVQMKPIQ